MIKDNSNISDALSLEFPDELSGKVMGDINLEILALDSVRIIDAYLKEGELTDIQIEVLRENDHEMEEIMPFLTKKGFDYFRMIHLAIKELIKLVEGN